MGDGVAADGLLLRQGDDDGRTEWSFKARRRGGRREKRELKGLRPAEALGYDVTQPAHRAGGPFQEVRLGPGPADSVLGDSVLLLPAVASASECAHLIAGADVWCGKRGPVSDAYAAEAETESLRRIEAHVDGTNLDGRSHALVGIILARALWCFEVLRPDLASLLFGQPAGLADMWFTFSAEEPMINRYTAGGEFPPHQDKHALTVLVPLSPLDAFEGGGTGFWSDEQLQKGWLGVDPTLVLRPERGTAMFWRGHITHGGLPVTSGVRHVLVASFNLRAPAPALEPAPS